MKPTYELKDGEILADGEKVATYDGTTLRMARGQAEEHKEAVEVWLDSLAMPENLAKSPDEVKAARVSRDTPPCPPGAAHLGDKDPEVQAWIAKHGPRPVPEKKK
jgi:hypothetical protein